MQDVECKVGIAGTMDPFSDTVDVQGYEHTHMENAGFVFTLKMDFVVILLICKV